MITDQNLDKKVKTNKQMSEVFTETPKQKPSKHKSNKVSTYEITYYRDHGGWEKNNTKLLSYVIDTSSPKEARKIFETDMKVKTKAAMIEHFSTYYIEPQYFWSNCIHNPNNDPEIDRLNRTWRDSEHNKRYPKVLNITKVVNI